MNSININIPNTTFGIGTATGIGETVKMFRSQKTLIITDKNLTQVGVVKPIVTSLEKCGIQYDLYDGCTPEPTISNVEALADKVKNGGYDLLIGVGGGSNLDTTKIVSVLAYSSLKVMDMVGKLGMPIEGRIVTKILIPTTSGTGAEWSQVVIIYEDNHEDEYMIMTSGILPDMVIIDPELTLNLPAEITADSGFDALTHAIEGFTCRNANSFSDMMASTAIRLVGENLRQVYINGSNDINARTNMSLAAALAINSMATGGFGICHPLSEIIQTKVHISHGKALSVLLPAVLEFNIPANPEKFIKIAELLGENISGLSVADATRKSVEAIKSLIRDLGLPQTLREVGVKENEIPELARVAYATRLPAFGGNPRDVQESDLENIYKAAY